jgi:hypothetical protein
LAYMLQNLSSDDSSEEYEVATRSKRGARKTKGQGPKKSKGKKDRRVKENKTSPSKCMKQLKNIKQCENTDQEMNNEGDMEVEMDKSNEGHDSPENRSSSDMAVEPGEENEDEAVEDAEPNDNTSVASTEWDGKCSLKKPPTVRKKVRKWMRKRKMMIMITTLMQITLNMMSANNITAQTRMALPEFEGTIILQPTVLAANPEDVGPEGELLIDSGATHHVFRSIKGIERFLCLNEDQNLWVEVADGGRMRMTHKGFAKGIGLILVCPDITRDILSLIQLLKNNTTFEMDNTGYTMKHGSGMVVKGPMNNNNTFHVPHGVFLLMLPRMAMQVFSNNAYIVLIQLKSKHLTAINYAFCELIAHNKKYRWNISKITCDSESVLRAEKTYLSHQGIILGHTPPHQHAQRAERYIRTLKDRVRTILSAMRFVLP